ISVIGGLLGLVPALWGLRFVESFPLDDNFSLAGVTLDWTAITFALLLSVATGFLFGLAPAIHAWRADVNDVLKGSSAVDHSGGGLLTRLRAVFVGTEVAVAMLLLVSAGLLLQSLIRLQSEDPGYNPSGVMTARLALSGDAYSTGLQQSQFFDRLE